MKRTLYLKFVLAYFIFGFFGFIVVATFTSNMTLEHMKRERADALYEKELEDLKARYRRYQKMADER